jgi:hypothetical protein
MVRDHARALTAPKTLDAAKREQRGILHNVFGVVCIAGEPFRDDRLRPCTAERLHRTLRDHPCSAQLGPTFAAGQTNNLDHPIALSTRLVKFGTPEIRPT